MRAYGEDIEVMLGTRGDQVVPVAFSWRGRRYAVREVLDTWVTRAAWWRAAARPEQAAPAWAPDAGDAPEEQLWRVAASPGRAVAAGVYDLARSASGWQLRGCLG